MPPYVKRLPFRRTTSSADTSPRVLSVTPNSDRAVGGVAVTITGQNFANAADGTPPVVLFALAQATSVVVVDAQTITCVAPANDPGLAGVSVRAPNGQTGTLPGCFLYVETVVLSIDPYHGPITGGTTVLITGANIALGAPTVLFNGISATSIVRIDAQHISCVTPAVAQGPVDVVVNDATVRGGFFFTLLTANQDLRRNPSLTITETINQPAVCAFTVGGQSPPPRAGEEFTYHDDAGNLLFGGVVQMVEQVYEGLPDQLAWNVTCTDYTAWLNRRRPFGTYNTVSATDVVIDLVSKFAPWVTTVHVQADLPAISLDLDGTQNFAETLTAIAQMIGGGYWRLDYSKDLHFIRTTLNSSQNDAIVVAVGAGDTRPTACVAVLGTTVAAPVYDEGFYAFCASFVYSNGVEGAVGPWSVPVLLDGLHLPDLSSIPTGAAVGGLTVAKRRIYYKFFGRRFAVTMAPFAEIADNVTTTLTAFVSATVTFRAPRRLVTAPPAAPAVALGVSQSDTVGLAAAAVYFPSLAGRVAYTFEPGDYAFVQTHVYDDGSESVPSVASAKITLDGFHAVLVDTQDRSEVINGRSVIFTKVYASIATISGQDPKFNSGDTGFWIIVPGSDRRIVEVVPGFVDIPSSDRFNDVVTPDPDDDPDDIVDGSTTLLQDPQITKVVDVSQLRNRVIVLGRQVSTLPPVVIAPIVQTPVVSTDVNVAEDTYYTNSVRSWITDGSPARGFPVNSRWNQIINDFSTLSQSTPPPPPPPDPPAPAPVQRRAGYGSGGVAGVGPIIAPYAAFGNNTRYYTSPVAGGNATLLTPVGPPAPPVQPQVVTRAPNPYPGGIWSYLSERYGVTKEYARAHPYTVFMDLAEDHQFVSTAGSNLPTSFPVAPAADDASTGNFQAATVTRPRYELNNEDSQRFMGQIELDSNGNPTDGIHEVVISTDLLTAEECLTFGKSQLTQFAWPLIRVAYGTRDPKSHPGKMVHIDLSHPPISGDFLITGVTIDQIKDEADTTNVLEPRRTVTAADPSKFNFDDLLMLIGSSEDGAVTVGQDSAAMADAMNAAKAYTDKSVSGIGGQFWSHVVKAGNTVRNNPARTADPELVITVVAGSTYIIRGKVWLSAEQGGPTLSFRWTGPALSFGAVRKAVSGGAQDSLTFNPGYTPRVSLLDTADTNTAMNTGGPGTSIVLLEIEAVITPSASGTFALEWTGSSGTLANAITARKGSYLEYAAL